MAKMFIENREILFSQVLYQIYLAINYRLLILVFIKFLYFL